MKRSLLALSLIAILFCQGCYLTWTTGVIIPLAGATWTAISELSDDEDDKEETDD